jgi:hypothetical protein
VKNGLRAISSAFLDAANAHVCMKLTSLEQTQGAIKAAFGTDFVVEDTVIRAQNSCHEEEDKEFQAGARTLRRTRAGACLSLAEA